MGGSISQDRERRTGERLGTGKGSRRTVTESSFGVVKEEGTEVLVEKFHFSTVKGGVSESVRLVVEVLV